MWASREAIYIVRLWGAPMVDLKKGRLMTVGRTERMVIRTVLGGRRVVSREHDSIFFDALSRLSWRTDGHRDGQW